MTTARIAERNRANARHSTGPKSARGKATVAGNARRHGATRRPDPSSVIRWLAIILDRPKITPDDLMHEDEAVDRALVLSRAEVRLVAAEAALNEFEARTELGVEMEDMEQCEDSICEELMIFGGTPREWRTGLALLKRIARSKLGIVASEARERRLLQRYIREAQAHRWRAFAAWAAVVSGATFDVEPGFTETKPEYNHK